MFSSGKSTGRSVALWAGPIPQINCTTQTLGLVGVCFLFCLGSFFLIDVFASVCLCLYLYVYVCERERM